MPFLGTTGAASVKQFGGQATLGYFLRNSLRFRSSASAYLNRTLTTPTNNIKWTWSGWVKRGALSGYHRLFGVGSDANGINQGSFTIDATGLLSFFQGDGAGATQIYLATTPVYRDPSAWYHFVLVYDSANATSSNRIFIYVNGVQVTAFSSATYPTSSLASKINAASVAHAIGVLPTSPSNYLDGYLTEINFIDGQALTPSSFGKTNAVTGQWNPKKYTGAYGTNGFYLKFADASAATAAAIGKDSSSNGNNWTPNNISVTAGVTYDSMTDVPTLTSATAANYCVLNPLDNANGATITNGNLQAVNGSTDKFYRATLGVSSGTYYWEVLLTTVGNRNGLGITDLSLPFNAMTPSGNYALVYVGWSGGGASQTPSSGTFSGTIPTFSNGDYVTFALDVASGILYFEKNAAPNTSTSPKFTGLSTSSTYIPSCREPGGTVGTNNFNFGQRPFSFSPPSGFVALNTFNL